MEFADADTGGSVSALASPVPIAEGRHTIFTARVLVTIVVVGVVFGAFVLWRALPADSNAVPKALRPYVAGHYKLYRNGAFSVRMPAGFAGGGGRLTFDGQTTYTKFATAKVGKELVEVVSGVPDKPFRARTSAQAADLAEVMRAGTLVASGASFVRTYAQLGTWRTHPAVDAEWKGPQHQTLRMRVTLVGRRFVVYLALVHGNGEPVVKTMSGSFQSY